jgi:hypothetical protein
MPPKRSAPTPTDDGSADPPQSFKKTKFSDLKTGQWISRLSYCKIKTITGDSAVLENESGFAWSIAGNIVEAETFSPDQYGTTAKVTSTQLAEILTQQVGDTVITVRFTKQAKPEDVLGKLTEPGDNLINIVNDKKGGKNLAKSLLVGEERDLVGYVIKPEPLLGRTKMVDLNITAGGKDRLVDHRTIKHIIFKGTKYELK